MIHVLINAKIGDQSIWAEPGGLAARAYGVAVCISLKDWARYTPVRFLPCA